jgi:hypothetical protein
MIVAVAHEKVVLEEIVIVSDLDRLVTYLYQLLISRLRSPSSNPHKKLRLRLHCKQKYEKDGP